MSGSDMVDTGRWHSPVRQLHNQIEQLAPSGLQHGLETEVRPFSGGVDAAVLALARQIRDELRHHAEANPGTVMEEYGIELLLALYVARHERRMFSISDLCDQSSMPPSSVIRCVTEYDRKGLIKKAHVNDNGRRIFVRLSHIGAKLMTEWLRKIEP
ncbi:MAG: winged helix DNA-binding protein [Sphingobium sp.]|jgi:DNA-binding MarR family transcriptional regulator|nr:winged helix DNA-binding protein [Sphingobium sp.]MCP5397881.1 winged helix DNA-binding protein [Sphingomonas sp.]